MAIGKRLLVLVGFIAHFNLAVACGAMGNPEEAVSEFKGSIKTDTLSIVARNRLGSVLEKMGLLDDAIAQ